MSAAHPPAGAASAVPADGARRHRLSRALTVATALVVGLVLLRLVIAEPFGIPSASMAPTLKEGDSVLVDKLAYAAGGTPSRGDLAVFRAPDTDEITLKRVVAVAGQSVGIEDGVLVVDGRRPAEPYADQKAIDSVYFGPVRVPPRTVFVLGDNRANSHDSREFGAVPTEDMIGRARARVWPPSRWGGAG